MLSFSANSQPTASAMEKLAAQLHSLAKNSPAELVYIQTSKGIYETGEDLWFKAYLLNAQTFSPSGLSQTLYLQMVKEKTGQATWQEKYEIQNGFADGHVFLQDTLSEGDYLLEAFTGHSFFGDSTEFKAVRKIKVKKDMAPRPSLTADFDRIFYKSGDTIKVKITALTKQRKPLYAEMEAELRQGNKRLGQATTATNAQGLANLVFALRSAGEGLRVEVKVKYEGKEEQLSFPVPCKKGNPIQFDSFPEGGNLVAGIQSKLVFKAVNIDGNPLDVEGALFEGDTPLLEFKSAHAGMGSLGFTPLAGKKYSIRLSKPVTDSTFLLPEIYPEGITLRLAKRDADYLEFMVSQSAGQPTKTIYLRGQLRGVVYSMATGELNKELKIKIPLNQFPGQGIAAFTLFNDSLVPVAERLVYVNPDRKLYIEAQLSKERYETREKAVLKITVKDENGDPAIANLGISVYDKLYQNHADAENIMAHCYLSSQLKGKIYDPAFYFDGKNPDREEALDLLLLAQGWRRYVWSEPALKEYGSAKQLVIFDGVKGEVYATEKLKKARRIVQYVQAKQGRNNNIVSMMADSADNFVITSDQLKAGQGGYVYLTPLCSEYFYIRFKPQISLSDPFQTINEITKAKEINYPLPGVTIVKEVEPLLVGQNVIKLAEVTVKGSGIPTIRDKFLGHLDSLQKMRCYVCENNILNCVNHPPSVGSKTRKSVEGEKYGIYIRGIGGTVIFHYPNFTEEELLKIYNLSRVKAYYPHREFYQPKYDEEKPDVSSDDFRNTLYWGPSVVTNEKGEATVEFFCSDINTGFVGSIEGVGGEGLLGSADFGFFVNERK